MKLYISGPITGMLEHNKPAFKFAQNLLLTAGYEVINPHEIGQPAGYENGVTWADYLRMDLLAILSEDVQGIAVLPGHNASRGAKLECYVASELEMPIAPVKFWLDMKKENK